MTSRELELTELQKNLFYPVVSDVLGNARPRAFLTLHLDGKVWTLIVVEDDVRLVRLRGEGSEIRYLGRLRGSYSEQMTVGEHDGIHIGLRFDVADQRFPGGRIELELVPIPRAGFVSDMETQRDKMIRDHLRPWFRACADKPLPPPQA